MKQHISIICCLLIWGSGYGVTLAEDFSTTGDREESLKHLALKTQLEDEQRLEQFSDTGIESIVSMVVYRLWACLESAQPPVVVKVIQEAVPDATTYPNGVIYLTTGMLVHTRSEDQLAMILSHEIIHYVRRHTFAAYNRSKIVASDGNGDNAILESHAQSQQALAQWRAAAEQQADEEGLALMRAAGYCPAEVLALLADLQKTNESDKESASPFSFDTASLRQRNLRFQRLLAPNEISDRCKVTEDQHRSYLERISPALIADAQAAAKRGLWSQAAMDLQRVLDFRPDDAQAYFLLGEVENRRGDRQAQAMACFEKAILFNNGFAPAYRALGVIHFKAGEREQARRYFETSLALAPQDGENEFIRGYLQQCSN